MPGWLLRFGLGAADEHDAMYLCLLRPHADSPPRGYAVSEVWGAVPCLATTEAHTAAKQVLEHAAY